MSEIGEKRIQRLVRGAEGDGEILFGGGVVGRRSFGEVANSSCAELGQACGQTPAISIGKLARPNEERVRHWDMAYAATGDAGQLIGQFCSVEAMAAQDAAAGVRDPL